MGRRGGTNLILFGKSVLTFVLLRAGRKNEWIKKEAKNDLLLLFLRRLFSDPFARA